MLSASYLPNELLVQYEGNIGAEMRAAARERVQGTLAEVIQTAAMRAAGHGVLERVALPPGLSVQSAMTRFQNLPGVAYAEPNYILEPSHVSNDSYYANGSMWGMYSDDSPTAVGPSGTTNQYGSQAEEAWNDGFIGSPAVYVGIVDTGYQYAHPDLARNAWENPFEIPGDGIDNDGNGYIDDVYGWDFHNNDNSIFDPADGDSHGTHVAGTIGAEGGNGSGVVGVNWNTTMIGAKFLGPDGGYTSNAVKALDYLTDLKQRHGLNIVASNNSWGGGGYSTSLHNAILRAAKADILFVAAAGNSGSNNDTTANYPSNYSTTVGTSTESAVGYEAVIAVASITSSGAMSSFSSYGASTVDLGAPGSSILSTVPSNSYAYYSGTSMATPHVTGAVALYAAAYPSIRAGDIRAAVLNSTTPTASLSGKTATGGRLNIASLMALSPHVGIAIDDVGVIEGNSGTKDAVFTVSLSVASTETVTVDFATADGTATAGSDYAAASGTLTFKPGETSKTVAVAVHGDTVPEADETFYVNLTNPVNASLTDAQGKGTIVNDDTLSLSIDDVTLNEGNSGTTAFVFTVSLSGTASQSVSVKYATANGTASSKSDYYATSGTLNFAVGETVKYVTVAVRGDTSVEKDETFYVKLSSAVNASIADNQGLGIILNDDTSTKTRTKSFAANETWAAATYAELLETGSVDNSATLAALGLQANLAGAVKSEGPADDILSWALSSEDPEERLVGRPSALPIAGAPHDVPVDEELIELLLDDWLGTNSPNKPGNSRLGRGIQKQ
jgi:subtilisin family serine protease